jgi:hypothetical protein
MMQMDVTEDMPRDLVGNNSLWEAFWQWKFTILWFVNMILIPVKKWGVSLGIVRQWKPINTFEKRISNAGPSKYRMLGAINHTIIIVICDVH